MKNILAILTLIGCSHQGIATTYYFSNGGNDSNSGKSKATAWCTLRKVSEVERIFESGDSLLFERGGLFNGQITIITSGLYMGAYGVGPKPIISASIELTKWIAHNKNIWKAECLNCTDPANLFIDNKAQPAGRYPNAGYLSISGTSLSGTTITDTSLPFQDGYWNGAEIVVRTGRWTIDRFPAKKYSRKTFAISSPSSYRPQPGNGYFIQKHLSTLDRPGEWFYESSSNQIYLFLATGANPEQQTIYVSVLDFGLSITSAHNVVIENLIFEHQRLAGVVVKNCRNVSLQHIEILRSGKNGLEMINCKNACVEDSFISDTNNNGVEWHNNAGGTFSRNTISRTGIYPGRGASGDGTCIALRITADKAEPGSNLFEFNTIDSTGYIGIDFRTGNTIIRDNNISNFCLTKDDGGGIYTWENAFGNNIIENNTISNGIGSGEGTIHPMQRFANGIYIDDRSSHILIKNNEISNCATSGIFLHNAKIISIIANRLYKNGNTISNKEKGQLYIKLDTLGHFAGDYDLQLTMTGNKLISAHEASYCFYLSADKEQHLQKLGKIGQNEFRAQRVEQAVAELHNDGGFCLASTEFSLEDWQRESGYEEGSTFTQLLSEGSSIVGENLIASGSNASSTSGWIVWPDELSLAADKKKGADGFSLQVIFSQGSTEGLLYHGGFSLRKGALYRLSFSARGIQDGKLEFVPLMANSPWQALGDYTCFSIDSTSKTFTYYFRADQDNASARVNFKSNATFWIDSVSLYEIIATTVGH